MVSGENAKAAGVIRDRFVKAELGREIGDRLLDRAARARFSVGVFLLEIMAEGFVHFLELAQKTFVLRDLDETGLPRELEHPDGIVVRAIPKLRIEMTKKAAGRGFPGPPQIENHLTQRLERGRQRGDHIIRVVGRHGACAALDRKRSVNLTGKTLASSVPWAGRATLAHDPRFSC